MGSNRKKKKGDEWRVPAVREIHLERERKRG